jgi:hypothetical protein
MWGSIVIEPIAASVLTSIGALIFCRYCYHCNLLTHGAEPFLRSRQSCSHSRTSQHLIEPEGSIPCSHEPSTGPYPEPYQSNPHYNIPSCLSKIHVSIVHPPTSWSSQWSLYFWLSHQYPICIHREPHSCYMPRQSHPPWLDHSNYTWRRVQVMKITATYKEKRGSVPKHKTLKFRNLSLDGTEEVATPSCPFTYSETGSASDSFWTWGKGRSHTSEESSSPQPATRWLGRSHLLQLLIPGKGMSRASNSPSSNGV